MTSTVLDVGLFLLCVSASVVTVVNVDPAHGGSEYHADDLTDRIATETMTVEYTADAGDRRRHASLAEHLVTAAARKEPGSDSDSGSYVNAVRAAIKPRLDPGTAVAIRLPIAAKSELDGTDSITRTEGTDRHRTAFEVGRTPPATARVRTSVVQMPAEDGRGTARIVVRRWHDGSP